MKRSTKAKLKFVLWGVGFIILGVICVIAGFGSIPGMIMSSNLAEDWFPLLFFCGLMFFVGILGFVILIPAVITMLIPWTGYVPESWILPGNWIHELKDDRE